MHDVLRRIHLYTGTAILVFLVMYFVTGYPMIHHRLLPDSDPEKTTRTHALRYRDDRAPQVFSVYLRETFDLGTPAAALPVSGPVLSEFSAYLQETFDLGGKRQEPARLGDGSWRFRYWRPGTAYEAVVSVRGDSVRITQSRDSLRRTLVGFHRLHRYGDGWLYSLWAFCYDLAGLSLILFAVTGVWMWYRMTRRHLLGWLLLGMSFAYAGATILYLIYAP
ncbi:MAG: PepSY-associated TM helix domain-containing protein [Candidatus Latescibacterota bacterium]